MHFIELVLVSGELVLLVGSTVVSSIDWFYSILWLDYFVGPCWFYCQLVLMSRSPFGHLISYSDTNLTISRNLPWFNDESS